MSARTRRVHRAISAAATAAAAVAAFVLPLPPRVRAATGSTDTALPPALVPRTAVAGGGMVACGSPEAARAGAAVLAAGGNAVDAAVAASLALGAAEPGGSGLGGQTYALLALADGRRIAIDGSATAPVRTARDEVAILEGQDTQPDGYWLVATPSTLAALADMHAHYGSLPWADLVAPAIEIAENGYTLGSCAQAFLGSYRTDLLRRYYDASALIAADGEPRPVGSHVCLDDLADTLRTIAVRGPSDFYTGGIARRIVLDMHANRGYVAGVDLATLRILTVTPFRGRYRDVEVLAFPSPGAGGSLIEALNIIERFPPTTLTTPSATRLQILVEAARIAEADELRFRSRRTMLPRVLESTYLSKRFAARRAQVITPGTRLDVAALPPGPALPWGLATVPAVDRHRDTTHLSVIDRFGNAVSVTQSLGRQYGAKVATPGLGFFYNSLLEGFDTEQPASPTFLRPKAVTFSSMTPVILLRDGRPFAVLGSTGSDRLVPSLLNVISNLVDGGMPLPDAVAAPRVLWGEHNRRILVEMAPPIEASDVDALATAGYETIYRQQFPPRPIDISAFGGVNAVAVDWTAGTFVGVGDPRRDGGAAGATAPAGALGTPPS